MLAVPHQSPMPGTSLTCRDLFQGLEVQKQNLLRDDPRCHAVLLCFGVSCASPFGHMSTCGCTILRKIFDSRVACLVECMQ